MGKLLAPVLVVALSAATVAAYNAFVYELVQPVPLSAHEGPRRSG